MTTLTIAEKTTTKTTTTTTTANAASITRRKASLNKNRHESALAQRHTVRRTALMTRT